MANSTPLEAQEQAALAEWLDWQGVCYTHVPNEGKRSRITGHNLKRQGLKPGFPDVLVFDPPKGAEYRGCRGVAIELKRQKGGRLQDEQREWLDRLGERNWFCAVCKGADEAIRLLESLGYGKRSA